MSGPGVTSVPVDGGPALPVLRATPGEVDVLTIGSYFCDVVFSGLLEMPKLGDEIWASACSVVPGGTYITAAALHRLNVSSAWACRFGSDPFSRFVRSAADAEGMDPSAYVSIDEPVLNISIAMSFPADRSFVSFAEPLPPADFTAIDALRPRLIVKPGLGEPQDLIRLLDAADKVGAAVVVDPQASEHTLDSAVLRAALRRVAVLAPNEREALKLSGQTDIDAAVAALREVAPLVVVKLGADGAIAADRGAEVRVDALSVTPLETTGAGDCFNAGFIMAMLEGEDAVGCLQAGNAAGALSTLAASSLGIPTREEVDLARRRFS